MIDAVLDYHMSPHGCGVSKFNFALAKRLGVPCLPLMPWPWRSIAPLVSVKASEMTVADREWLADSVSPESGAGEFDVLWHDGGCGYVTERARRVFFADKTGCPSTVDGNATRGTYRVLAFGMAHKLNLPHFEALQQQLEIEHPDYTIELSTAVHEGNPWDKALTESVEAMRGIFGDKLRVLGFLGDDALAKELREVDAVAAFYQPALRANNTSYWAAVEAGKHVYTNRDAHSPQEGDPPASWEALVALIKGAA